MTKADFKLFQAEMRELCGAWDLEIWEMSKLDGGFITVKIIPFAAHMPLKRDPRGAKPGVKKNKKATPVPQDGLKPSASS